MEIIALVTDRGTPIISDPGYKTVKYITDNNYNVVALPGPTAFVPALITSGISSSTIFCSMVLDSKDSLKRVNLRSYQMKKKLLYFMRHHTE